jgi:hypothetical protein
MPAWRVALRLADASGSPVSNARLATEVWTGGATVERTASRSLDTAEATFPVDEPALSIAVHLRHDRFAPLTIALTRSPGETVWRWTSPAQRVATRGSDIDVAATLRRVVAAPAAWQDERVLQSRAEALQGRLDDNDSRNRAAAKRGRPPTAPTWEMIDADPGAALTDRDRTAYRSALPWLTAAPRFRIAEHNPLADDASAAGWGRFRTRLVSVDPSRSGRLYLVEYGEVGDAAAAGPRFLVGMWVPQRLHTLGLRELDFVVWLHPHTNNRRTTPQSDFPFRSPYPYAIVAVKNPSGRAVAAQRFPDIACAHIGRQHYLAHALEAAAVDAVLVVPVAPSSHFEPFESRQTLMRMLRELCLWIPRDDDRGRPAVHSAPPTVGRVVVSGFSSSVPRLTTLMTTRTPAFHYGEAVWGTPADAVAFDAAWRQQWAIDGVNDGFGTYLHQAASWVRSGSDRRIRIYKSDFTSGRWNPQAAQGAGAWSGLVRGATPAVRRHGKLFGLWVADSRDRWHALSVSNDFVLAAPGDPAAAEEPPLVGAPHELMPRICFGHAAATSGLARR